MTISDNVRKRINELAENRCGYCLVSAEYIYATMEIDHLIPVAEGGTDAEENLWLACPRCNGFKSDQTHGIDPDSDTAIPLYNPRIQNWYTHFMWDERTPELIMGKTSIGRATIIALKMNNEDNLRFRRLLVSVGWYPPKS